MNYSTVNPVSIAIWEYLFVIFYMVFIGILYSRRKNIQIKRHPEYRYYITGLFSKILGGVFFSMIYVYYYGNGDTISFFRSALPLAEIALQEPGKYFTALFSPNTMQNYYKFFNQDTGYPLGYVYRDPRSYILVRIISPFVILSFKSFLLTGAIISTIAFGGVWHMYRTFLRYYPRLQSQLAFAIIFFPSSVFWGSGIMKDTFTFTALGWFVYSMDLIFFLKKDRARGWMIAIFAAFIMITMKPYIFMMIFPSSLLWILYHRVARIRNALLRALLLPMAMAILGYLTFFTLNSLGDRLSKFSIDRALETIVTAQEDLKRSDQYGDNFFDLGEIEPTWTSVLSKFPTASFAGLFRPSLLEANNAVMLLAALENTWLLLFFIYILVRTRIYHFITLLRTNPLLQMCYLFALGYAFMIGITTPNFGAMVRFKIPLLPFLVAGMFITSYILDRRREVIKQGRRFDFDLFVNGDPGNIGQETWVSGPGTRKSEKVRKQVGKVLG